MRDGGRSGRAKRTRHQALVGATIAAMALLVVACQPVTFGSPGAQVGNDLNGSCPGMQPSNDPPCGPQPLLWASINGPYAPYLNGDPYSTVCVRAGSPSSGPSCQQRNPSYRPSGYAYGIDVAAADVGMPLTLQGYDVGAYPRTVIGSTTGTRGPSREIDDLVTTNGSPTVKSATAVFTTSDVGQPVFSAATGSKTISAVTNSTTASLNQSATATGTFSATIGYDCDRAREPFNAAAYTGMSVGNCQTGDDTDVTGQNFDVQVYDNDGSGTVSYATPLTGCHFSHSAAELSASRVTYKNSWVELCTFTPTQKGIYAFRVRNSGIAGMTDAGQGINGYALKVLGGTTTKLHALDDQSIFVNVSSGISRAYLIDVPKSNAGKKLLVDLFDPGDGPTNSTYTVQVKAPPGGGPSPIPAGTGVTVPAAGVATACMYNDTPSLTIAPATPDVATNCTVTTSSSTAVNKYNGSWLRLEITLDPAYTCDTDCWWTLEWNWGTNLTPTDRLTFTAKVA